MNKIKDNFKKLPKAAKVKTVKQEISWQDFLAQEKKNKKVSDAQAADVVELVKIFENATKWQCVMWGNMYGFGTWEYVSEKTGRNGIWPATAFAVRANGIVVYTMMGHANYPEILARLGKFKDAGKSCLSFKKLEDIHTPSLKKLIQTSLKDLKKKYMVT